MRSSSPFSGSTTVGTADRGARSDTIDWVRCSPGLWWTAGGDEERMPVVEVGIGVGYFAYNASLCEGEDLA
jgi:hypothetical protein